MAANGDFPSIYDKTENQEMWAIFNPNLRQVRSSQTDSRRKPGTGTGFVNQSSSSARRAEPPAICGTSNLLKEPEYRPLDVFGVAGEDRGSAPLSEADEICELCIQLKEFELCEMMEDAPKSHQSKYQRTFRTCRVKPRRRRIEKKQKTTNF